MTIPNHPGAAETEGDPDATTNTAKRVITILAAVFIIFAVVVLLHLTGVVGS